MKGLGLVMIGLLAFLGCEQNDGDAGGEAGTDGEAGTGEACGNPDADPECAAGLAQTGCEAHGGSFAMHGDVATAYCLCPTSDAGCPCDGVDDCEVFCWHPDANDCAEPINGTCVPFRPYEGCYCEIGTPTGTHYVCH